MDRRLIHIIFFIFIGINAFSQQEIKLESIDRPIIKIKINNIEANMLIDTGSTLNVINIGDVKKYGIRKRTKFEGQLYSASSNVAAWHIDHSYAYICDYRIHQFVSFDISAAKGSILNDTRIEITGILGTQAIKELGMIIDLKRGIVTIKK